MQHLRLRTGVLLALFLTLSAVLTILALRTNDTAAARVPFTLKTETFCVGSQPQVLLSWSSIKKGPTYSIYRKQQNSAEGWATVAKNISATSYTDSSLAKDKDGYTYIVKATGYRIKYAYSNFEEASVRECSQTDASEDSSKWPWNGNKPTKPSATSTNATTTPPTSPNNPPSQSETPPSTPTGALNFPNKAWGAFVGYSNSAFESFEAKIGQEADHQALFVGWGNESSFPSDVGNALKKDGKTLMIFWEAYDHNLGVNQPKFSYDAILRGDHDAYIKQFASDAKKFGGPVILIPFDEMNGDWYPWSGTKNGNTPEKHNQAYRHIHKFFENVPNVKFGWAPNNMSVPNTAANKFELYYPGDAYVDYVGIDGFNFNNGGWQTFDQIFGEQLKRLQKYKKPIYIFSFATAEGPQKAAWIKDALEVQIPKYPEIKGWNWFNEDKEKNWLIWSDANALGAFINGVD